MIDTIRVLDEMQRFKVLETLLTHGQAIGAAVAARDPLAIEIAVTYKMWRASMSPFLEKVLSRLLNEWVKKHAA